MVYYNSQDAISALGKCIDSLNSTTVYVGITGNLPQRIETHKQQYDERISEFVCRVDCQNSNIARDVENYFLGRGQHNGKKIDGGSGGGDNTSTIVYAFPAWSK